MNWSEDIRYIVENSSLIPTDAGAYKILVPIKGTDQMHRVYVGQSDDLRKRFLEHLSDEEPNHCLKEKLADYQCYFRFVVVLRQEDRDVLEQDLLVHGSYECNVRA